MNLQLKGNINQFTTTGKNQIGLKNLASTSRNGLTFSIENDILTINGTASAKVDFQELLFNLTQNTTKTLRFYLISGTFTTGNIGIHLNKFEDTEQVSFMQIPYSTADLKLTKTIDLTNVNYVWVYATSGSTFNNAKFKLMLSDNANDDYEPYTGGVASPNPDYPQDIKTISNNNKILICNKNLCDEIFESGNINDNGQETTSSTTYRSTNYYKVASGQTLICSYNATADTNLN
jgi:hypothetical protein